MSRKDTINTHPNVIAMAIIDSRHAGISDHETRQGMKENGYRDEELDKGFAMADIGRVSMTREEVHQEVDKFLDMLDEDKVIPRSVTGSYDVNGLRSICIAVLSEEEMK